MEGATFNIGDMVYVAESYHEYVANSQPYEIVGISIHTNGQTTKVIYDIHQEYILTTVSEKFIFATYEECEKWCKEHN